MTGPHPAEYCSGQDVRLRSWSQWLAMAAERGLHPAHDEDPRAVLVIHRGRLIEPERWPRLSRPRIYVALDDHGPVYVGQTTRPLTDRIRSHFGTMQTLDSRAKADLWRGMVTAAFPDPGPADLCAIERRAADWLLPWQHVAGRRHPRPAPSPET